MNLRLDNGEHLFMILGTIVLCTLILTAGFAKCDLGTEAPIYKKYKLCLEVTKDAKICQENFEHDDKPLVK